jgi:hypothetical protein
MPLIDYDEVRICLRTAATNGPIVHPPSDKSMWAWRAMVMMMPAGDNSWLAHQSSLAILPAERAGTSRRNGWRSENFTYQYLKYLKGSLTCHKILRHGTSGFTSHPKEGVLLIFIAFKNPSPRPCLNPRPLGPVASTLTTTPPRRQICHSLRDLYGFQQCTTVKRPSEPQSTNRAWDCELDSAGSVQDPLAGSWEFDDNVYIMKKMIFLDQLSGIQLLMWDFSPWISKKKNVTIALMQDKSKFAR